MRAQLQALVDRWHARGIPSILWVLAELKRILATEPPAVSVKAGWYAKDYFGVHWFERKPTWVGDWEYESEMQGRFTSAEDIGGGITDPWETSHPNGGPECIMEVKR